MTEQLIYSLIDAARQARESAYAPYSGFWVGSALLCEDGTCFTGCNIESAAYSPTLCAERTAFSAAVCAGQRRFRAIAVVGGPRGGAAKSCAPCGVCRQVMAEFCSPDFVIILPSEGYIYEKTDLRSLLPMAFGPYMLGDKRV